MRRFGGTLSDIGVSVALDPSSSSFVYAAGTYTSSTGLSLGAFTLAKASGSTTDVWVARLNSSNEVTWAVRAAGADADTVARVTVDGTAAATYVCGHFMSASLVVGPSVTLANSASGGGSTDLFVTRLDSSTGNVR